jgi:hypothetical protein
MPTRLKARREDIVTNREGKLIGENAIDAVAVAEERSPGCHLLAVQTTLVLREADGAVRILNVAKEREA